MLEFIVAAINKEKLLSKKKIDKAFRLFDIVNKNKNNFFFKDNDGFIDKSEFC